MSDTLWILLIGSLVATSCALVGCFLILRRLAMLSDAISHAALPGIVMAFLLTGGVGLVPALIGAGAFGLLTVAATDFLERHGRVQTDAAIGVVFTVFFALGVVMISALATGIHLDAEHVLFGEILFAPFNTWPILGLEIPRAAVIMGGLTILNLLFVSLCYKQLKVCAFDPQLAASIGISVAFWHYALMGAVSITAVASFESVGVVIVVAMLIVPANTAYMLTDRLGAMLVLAVIAGILGVLGGYGLAFLLDGSIAGAMATVSGALFVLAALFSPRHGVLTRKRRQRALELEPSDPNIRAMP